MGCGGAGAAAVDVVDEGLAAFAAAKPQSRAARTDIFRNEGLLAGMVGFHELTHYE